MSEFFKKIVAHGLRQKNWDKNIAFLQSIVDEHQLDLNYFGGHDFCKFFSNPDKLNFILKNGYNFEKHQYDLLFKSYLTAVNNINQNNDKNKKIQKKNKKIIDTIIEHHPNVLCEKVATGFLSTFQTIYLELLKKGDFNIIFNNNETIKKNCEDYRDYRIIDLYGSFFDGIEKGYNNFSMSTIVYRNDIKDIENKEFHKQFKTKDLVKKFYETFPIKDNNLWEVLHLNKSSLLVLPILFQLGIVNAKKEHQLFQEHDIKNIKSIIDVIGIHGVSKIKFSHEPKVDFDALLRLKENLSVWGFNISTENIGDIFKKKELKLSFLKEEEYLKFITKWDGEMSEYKKLKL